jgi:hypothetical protein
MLLDQKVAIKAKPTWHHVGGEINWLRAPLPKKLKVKLNQDAR